MNHLEMESNTIKKVKKKDDPNLFIGYLSHDFNGAKLYFW